MTVPRTAVWSAKLHSDEMGLGLTSLDVELMLQAGSRYIKADALKDLKEKIERGMARDGGTLEDMVPGASSVMTGVVALIDLCIEDAEAGK